MARLVDIAGDMAHQAHRTGIATRDLGHGLRLEMSWVGGHKTLVLSRPAVLPSEQEISICRHAFSVPVEAERRDGENRVMLRWPA